LWIQLWEDMKIWLMKLCAKRMLCTDEWVRASERSAAMSHLLTAIVFRIGKLPRNHVLRTYYKRNPFLFIPTKLCLQWK
jgi:hypothetical protein